MVQQLSGWLEFRRIGRAAARSSDPPRSIGPADLTRWSALYARPVDVEAVVDLAVPAPRVFAELKDLDGYSRWLSIVQKAEPDGPSAWRVDLSAGVGPLRVIKKLRMVRAVAEQPRLLRFDRAELDERAHSPWVLTAAIDGMGDGASRLTMHLHYGGAMRLPLVDLALRDEIRRAGPRLQRLLEQVEPLAGPDSAAPTA